MTKTMCAAERAFDNNDTRTTNRLTITSGASSVRWRRRLVLTGASVAALTALSAGPAAAQFWRGNQSSDWMDGRNWSGNAVPSGGAVVISTTSPNPTVLGVNGPATGRTGNLALGGANAAGSLTIQNGSTLTSTGAVVGLAGVQEASTPRLP